MRTVVGIGNPGMEYTGTRHNVGFDVVDALADELGLSFSPAEGPVLVAEGAVGGEPMCLLKPQAYVNRSGEVFLRFRNGEPGEPGDVLVVMDDLALDLGRLRFRASGSDGGHNGLRSMLAVWGGEAVPRLRVGIGRVDAADWKQHVLSPFAAEERQLLEPALERAVLGVRAFIAGASKEVIQNSISAVSLPGRSRETEAPGSAARAAAGSALAGRRQPKAGESQVADNLKQYEGMFVLNQANVPPEGGDAVGTVNALLTKHSAKVVKTEVWDERRLAYPIKRQKRGTYVISHFEAQGDTIEALSRDANISEDYLRYLFIRHEKGLPEFPKPRRELKEVREGPRGAPRTAQAVKKEAPAPAAAPAQAESAAETPAPEPVPAPAAGDAPVGAETPETPEATEKQEGGVTEEPTTDTAAEDKQD